MRTEEVGTEVGGLVVGGELADLTGGHQLGEHEGTLESWRADTHTRPLLSSLAQQRLDTEGRGVFENDVTLLQHLDLHTSAGLHLWLLTGTD